MTGTGTQNKKVKRLQLDQTQIGLLLGFVGVGLLLAFGAGFITGMWYQTKEQIRPLALEPISEMAADDANDQMTFYSTLARSDLPAASQPPVAPAHSPQPVPPHSSQSADPHVATLPNAVPEMYFSIQVGSFRARDEAEHLYTLLSSKGYKTVIKTALVPGKGILYRVRVGQFVEREAAEPIARRLKSQERLDVMITAISP